MKPAEKALIIVLNSVRFYDAKVVITLIAKQMDVRSNIKKYFDMAHEGEIIVIPRKENKNVVIMSEAEYDRLKQFDRITAYAGKAPVTGVSKKKKSAASSDMVRMHNIKKMDEISSFGDNWNGNGAPSFPKPLIKKVKGLLTALEIQPEVFPTALCTIQLEDDNSRKE